MNPLATVERDGPHAVKAIAIEGGPCHIRISYDGRWGQGKWVADPSFPSPQRMRDDVIRVEHDFGAMVDWASGLVADEVTQRRDYEEQLERSSSDIAKYFDAYFEMREEAERRGVQPNG